MDRSVTLREAAYALVGRGVGVERRDAAERRVVHAGGIIGVGTPGELRVLEEFFAPSRAVGS